MSDHLIDEIKKRTLIGVVSNELLGQLLVLKGGNAIDLVHGIGSRASIDLDFSIPGDLPEIALVSNGLEASLNQSFSDMGLRVFDFKLEPKPDQLSEDIADFWGGYFVEFKLVDISQAEALGGDVVALRRRAIPITPLGSPKFTIDISKHEYCEGREQEELKGHRLLVYSLGMLAAEKFRAICQQMPEYGPIVRRSRAGAPRARDFVDLHRIITHGPLDPLSRDFRELLTRVFAAKRVPLLLLRNISRFREFHEMDFQSVIDTVYPDEDLEPFDFYFDFVCAICRELEALGDV